MSLYILLFFFSFVHTALFLIIKIMVEKIFVSYLIRIIIIMIHF